MKRTMMPGMRVARAAIVGVVVLVAGCSSKPSAVSDAGPGAQEPDRAKLCADPAWKEDHLGVWFNLCRRDTAF
jgi:hypothetical protein